jgi:hypothetical protein
MLVDGMPIVPMTGAPAAGANDGAEKKQ